MKNNSFLGNSKWHALERRHSPMFLHLQDWEQLPYHFALTNENVQLRYNAVRCPKRLEPFLNMKKLIFEKQLNSESCSSYLLCKATPNKPCIVLSTPSEKGESPLFHVEKRNFYRNSCLNPVPIEFSISPAKYSKKRQQTAAINCSGAPGLANGGYDLLFDYFIQDGEDPKPITIELGGNSAGNSCVSMCKPSSSNIFKSRLEYSHKLRRKVYRISVNIEGDWTIGCLYRSFSSKESKNKNSSHGNLLYSKNKWILEFAVDLQPLTKALLMCTALFIIDEK